MRRLMAERRPSNSELRLRRLTTEELDSEPRGILEIFTEAEQADEDAPLARDDDDDHKRQ
jgi:phage terminase Nu1 subunit (DNA packaging protein)